MREVLQYCWDWCRLFWGYDSSVSWNRRRLYRSADGYCDRSMRHRCIGLFQEMGKAIDAKEFPLSLPLEKKKE